MTGHYFLAADPREISFIASGGAGPGWQRTGEELAAWAADGCEVSQRQATPLYRFYGTSGRGPNSHFFTSDRRECGAVPNDPGWTYESMPFRVWAPQGGMCPPNSTAFTRLYNGRAAENDSNHRYATKPAIVAAMMAKDWTDDGVAFCMPVPRF